MMVEVSDVIIYKKYFSLANSYSTVAAKLFKNTCCQHVLTDALYLKNRKDFKRLSMLK